VLQASCYITDVIPRYENIKNLIAELTELNCISYTTYRNPYCMELAFSQEPSKFRCLLTNDSQRMSSYFLQALFKILSLMPTSKKTTEK